MISESIFIMVQIVFMFYMVLMLFMNIIIYLKLERINKMMRDHDRWEHHRWEHDWSKIAYTFIQQQPGGKQATPQ